jgi:hypothetical protein
VSIGIPTYQRVASLERAVRSALSQTHRDLEVVICDNGSSDGTEEACRRWMARDPRLRYLRQPVNRGPIANFNAVLGELRGEYAMLLADDDWLDEDYVACCLEVLRTQPDYAMVGGRARHVGPDGLETGRGDPVGLDERRPERRLGRYLREVDDNGIFYGLTRRRCAVAALPMPDVLGADWLYVAGIAFQGRIRTIEETAVNRAVGGTSASIAGIMRSVRRTSRLGGRLPWVVTAGTLFAQVAWRSPAYGAVGRARRWWIAAGAALAAMRWRSSAYLLVAPMLLRVGSRPRARAITRAFLAVARRSGRVREGDLGL